MPGWKTPLLAAGAALALASAQAAPLTFDFTASGGTVAGSGHAITRHYTAGDVGLTVSGLGLATLNGTLANAAVGQYAGAGLGICNGSEGLNCGSPAHQADNAGGYELFLLRFDQAVTIDSAVVRTYSKADTDVSYFLGNVTTPLSLSGQTLASLSGFGFGEQLLDSGGSGNNAINTVTIGGGTYNALLLGARLGESNDAFKLQSLMVEVTAAPTTPDVAVPGPGALAVFATGLASLALFARQRTR